MGNLIKKNNNTEEKDLCLSSMERETKLILHYLIGQNFSKRTETDKYKINNKISHIFNNFDEIKEEEFKVILDYQKTFFEVITSSKEKFRLLKIGHYGLFNYECLLDNDNLLINMTKELVCNSNCYKISRTEKYRTRFSLF